MWTEIIYTILGVILIVIVVIARAYMMKRITKIPVLPNMPIVENNYRSEFTEGYTLGTLKEQVPCKNGCDRLEYYPTDVEQGEGIPRPPVQTVIVKSDLVKRFAKGKLPGSRRERIKLLTRDPSKIPQEMKDTDEGKWETREGQLGHLRSVFGKMISAGDEAIAEAMKEYARGEITKNAVGEMRTHYQNKAKSIEKDQVVDQKPKTS